MSFHVGSGLTGILEFVIGLVHWLVMTLGAACVLFIVLPQKLPPALQTVDSFGPMIAARCSSCGCRSSSS